MQSLSEIVYESQLWKSIFRHPMPVDRRNRIVVMLTNFFLHLHPVSIKKQRAISFVKAVPKSEGIISLCCVGKNPIRIVRWQVFQVKNPSRFSLDLDVRISCSKIRSDHIIFSKIRMKTGRLLSVNKIEIELETRQRLWSNAYGR